MPTPLIYDGRLYVLNNDGIFDCYDLESGEEIYRQRIPHVGGGFSASPVAADGKLYLPGEDGDVFAVRSLKFVLGLPQLLADSDLILSALGQLQECEHLSLRMLQLLTGLSFGRHL